jgi:hypothetical protein
LLVNNIGRFSYKKEIDSSKKSIKVFKELTIGGRKLKRIILVLKNYFLFLGLRKLIINSNIIDN